MIMIQSAFVTPNSIQQPAASNQTREPSDGSHKRITTVADATIIAKCV
jgi:hypothetical protein